MPTSRHERSEIEEFLDRDFRQVWAADRATGEPRFLPDGQAKELRAEAKAHWCCPVPDCRVEITTVGGSTRRHHFRHNQPSPHASDGESEFHLAAKAMLAAWAESRKPSGAVVQEERSTTKDPKTSRWRIADVMVTWSPDQQTAFEVEYKNYAPDDWALKQSDYDSNQPHPIGCVWLLGHLRIKRPPKNSYAADDPTVVRIPALAQRWLSDSRPVLAINPVTRQIGTILKRDHLPSEPTYPTPDDTYGHLSVDAVDDCELDPMRGLITPTMRRVEEAARRKAEAEQRRRDEEERARAERERRAAYYEDLRRKQRETWEATVLHNIFNQRWGRTPELLGTLPNDPIDQSGVWAHPTHWRGTIYEELIHPFALGAEPTLEDQLLSAALLPPRHDPRFTFHDIRVALSAHQINTHQRDPKKTYKAVLQFMERLQTSQIIAIHRDPSGKATHFEPTGYPLAKAEAEFQARRATEANRARSQRELLRGVTSSSDARRVAEANRARAQFEARRRSEERRTAATLPPTTQRQVRPKVDRSLCTQCDTPLPSWQRGGSHSLGCPPSDSQSN